MNGVSRVRVLTDGTIYRVTFGDDPLTGVRFGWRTFDSLGEAFRFAGLFGVAVRWREGVAP
jgi:hypothetical protein